MKPAASIETVLDFCNKVRKAGGGKPLDALLPGIPSDSESCLIAKNLNFECSVCMVSNYEGASDTDVEKIIKANEPEDAWIMKIGDQGVRDKIAKALDLETLDLVVDNEEDARYAVILPRKIGNVAANFDDIYDTFVTDFESARDEAINQGKTPEQADRIAWRAATKNFTRAMKQYAKYAEVVEAA